MSAPLPQEWARSAAEWRAERDRADPLPPFTGGDVWAEAERRAAPKRAAARAILRRHGLLQGPPSQEEIDDARATRELAQAAE
jgi:hypothetical protein